MKPAFLTVRLLHSYLVPPLQKGHFISAVVQLQWMGIDLNLSSAKIIYLARIIHQPEKSTGEGGFVVQMSHQVTVSRAHDALKPSLEVVLTLPTSFQWARSGARRPVSSLEPTSAA
jgi:hypothetical protein